MDRRGSGPISIGKYLYGKKRGLKLRYYVHTGYLTTEWGFCRPLCAKGMPVTYFFRI